MKRFTFLTLASVLVNVVVSLVVAGLLLAWQRGFGSGDTVAFFFWTLPLAIGLAAVGPVVLRLVERMPARVRWVLVVGASLLLAFGWSYGVASALGPWAATFSFPLVYPWLGGVAAQLFFQDYFLVHTSKEVVGWRNLLLVPGVLLVVVGGFWLSACLANPMPETYLIPANFRGEMRVVYGEPGGVDPPVENGRRVLQISPDGIAIIQPKYKAGLLDNEYYLVNGAGGRQRLADGTQAPVPDSPLPTVRFGGTSVSSTAPDGSYSTDSPLAIIFTYLTVGDPDTTVAEAVLLREQRRGDSLMTELVKRSRTKP